MIVILENHLKSIMFSQHSFYELVVLMLGFNDPPKIIPRLDSNSNDLMPKEIDIKIKNDFYYYF